MPPKQRNQNRSRRVDKDKRKRTVLSSEQLNKLEKVYNATICPERHVKQKLCQDIEMSQRFVNTWFQNRRAKEKRERDLKSRRIAQDMAENTDSSVSIKAETDVPMEIKVELDNSTGSSESDDEKMPVNEDSFEQTAHKNEDCEVNIMTTEHTNEVNINNPIIMPSTSTDAGLHHRKEVKKRPNMRTKPFHNQNTNVAKKDDMVDLSSPPVCRKIRSVDLVKNGSGEPDDTYSSPIQDLLKLTNDINNQMNWGTFGMTSTTKGSVGLNISERKETDQIASPCTAADLSLQENYLTKPRNTADAFAHLTPTNLHRTHPAFADINVAPYMETTTKAALSETAQSYGQNPHPPTLFRAIINMIAIKEGGIMSVNHPEFDHSVNDALYGIRINNGSRLVYTKEDGLDLVDDVPI